MTIKNLLFKKFLAALLAILIAVSPAYASSWLTSPDDADLKFISSEVIWSQLAHQLYADEAISSQWSDVTQIERILFADYLDYLNSIGIELAAFEMNHKAKKEIKKDGQCSKESLASYTNTLLESVKTNSETFIKVYCESACRQKAAYDFSLIAHYTQPIGDEDSCEYRAKEMYNKYNCKSIMEMPEDDNSGNFRQSKSTSRDILGQEPTSPENSSARRQTPPILNFGPEGDTAVKPSNSNKNTIESKAEFSTPANRYTIDDNFAKELKKKDTECKKEAAIQQRVIYAAPDSTLESQPTTKPYNGLDPRWTTTSPDEPEKKKRKNEPNISQNKNPLCKLAAPEQIDHFAELRAEYNKVSLKKISSSLAHWPIFDKNDTVEKDYLRLILSTSDALFLPLIDRLEAKYKSACGTENHSMKNAESASYETKIGGKKYTVNVTNGPDQAPDKNPDKEKEKKTTEPKKEALETIATHFNQSNSSLESFIDGLIGSTQTGAATPIESRAAAIASGVKSGEIERDKIAEEAGKNVNASKAKEIKNKTRQYLEQGDFQNLSTFAAEFAGGMLSGSLVSGGIPVGVKAIREAANAGGQLSKLFMVTKEIILRPMGPLKNKLSLFSNTKKLFDSAKKLNIPPEDLKRVTNQAHHVFAPHKIEGHKLTGFLAQHNGDTLAAFKSIENAAQNLADQGKLSGIFDGVPIVVDGVTITVKGRIMDGAAKISTAYIP